MDNDEVMAGDAQQPQLSSLRDALQDRALADVDTSPDKDIYATGFLSGMEHARLVATLFRDSPQEILSELENEEREMRRHLADKE